MDAIAYFVAGCLISFPIISAIWYLQYGKKFKFEQILKLKEYKGE